jgi:nucleoid-associated protein YgaU
MAGNLEKLTIHVFDTKDETGYIDQENESSKFVVQYNPTNYTLNYGVKLDSTSEDGDGGEEEISTPSKVKSVEPDNVSFTFLLDATNASPSATIGTATGGINVPAAVQTLPDGEETVVKNIVSQQIDLFKKITKVVNEKTHEVPLLIISWGTFVKQVICKNVSIAYELFDASGQPIRATVTANFKQQTFEADINAYKKLFSPDLTKVRLVTAGETIFQIANNEYGNPSLYTEIARVNNLTNFRRLRAGQNLVLPPIDKTN